MSSHHSIGQECSAIGTQDLTLTAHPNREMRLGELKISRALPIRERRMVGPWCFLDRFGPINFTDEKPMNVPPHPHIGLQTVSWLLEGEVLHTDSLGSTATVRPGGVNVMTAGQGIAHAEETPPQHTGKLSGVQLWVALPDAHRHTNPAFTCVEQVPVYETSGSLVSLFAGKLEEVASPAPHFGEILGAQIQVHPGHSAALPLNQQFEHALLLLDGDCSLEKQTLSQNTLYYLGMCRESLDLTSQNGCQLLLIGGPPFPEKILMWWNFVARLPEEIRQARDDWENHQRFGEVKGTQLKRLSSPDLAHFAHPNPAS